MTMLDAMDQLGGHVNFNVKDCGDLQTRGLAFGTPGERLLAVPLLIKRTAVLAVLMLALDRCCCRSSGLRCRTGLSWRVSSAHVQELCRHYARGLLTAAEIASRSPIVLTERDQDLPVSVHRHGCMTTDLVELAWFPRRIGSRSWSSSKAYARLRELWLWVYPGRIELPVARVLGRRRPFLSGLGSRASPWSSRIGGRPRCPCSRGV